MTVANERRSVSKTKRKTDYLFQRPGSANWYVKLQSPGKRVEKSLGTPDRRQAEILALPMIGEHKSALLAARPRLETIWRHQLEPGREHAVPDGGRILATDRDLFYIGHNGSILGPSRMAAQPRLPSIWTNASACRRLFSWTLSSTPRRGRSGRLWRPKTATTPSLRLT